MIETVGDLRRALEGVSDDTLLFIETFGYPATKESVCIEHACLLLSADGTTRAFVIEPEGLAEQLILATQLAAAIAEVYE